MTYVDFETTLVPGDIEKENSDESYRNRYQKHIAGSFGYKLVCVDGRFTKLFNSYFGKDVLSNFINSMIKESKCYNPHANCVNCIMIVL